MTYDVIIIGGGPAACAAAVYVARKKLRTLLIAESFGGQSIVSDDIQNWIGDPHLSGFELAKKLEQHVRAYPDEIEVKVSEKVTRVTDIECADGKRSCDFEVTTDQMMSYRGKAVIVASGARRRPLGVPGEEKFNGKGVSYCSTCDAPLFRGKTVAVVGGGNAGVEAVVDLLAYSEKVYLFNRGNVLTADLATQDDIIGKAKVEILHNVEVLEIVGEQFVTGIRIRQGEDKAERTVVVNGVFVEVGSVPNSEIVKDMVSFDRYGQIVIDAKHATTSHPGIFAAGDVTDDPYKQNNISAGDGVRAALAAYAYILNRKKVSPTAG